MPYIYIYIYTREREKERKRERETDRLKQHNMAIQIVIHIK